MVRFVRRATIRPGKIERALAFANEMSAFVKSKQGVDVNLFLQAGGTVGRICWQVDYADVGALEKANNELLSDAEYIKKVEAAADCFAEGDTRDSIWVQA